MLIITSKQPGFRRCGVAHPAEPTEHPDDAFTPEQIEILRNEPMLVVLEAEEARAELTNKPVPAAELIAFVGKLDILEELEKVAEGETRKTVLDAIAARRQGLEDGKIALVKAADKEELAKLAEGETRKAVQDAIVARSQELEA